ncbi:MAG: hypothetical protein ACLU38_16325 [Dysosmobacter sp.]
MCDTTIALLKNPDHDVASTLLAPDFPTGGQMHLRPGGAAGACTAPAGAA